VLRLKGGSICPYIFGIKNHLIALTRTIPLLKYLDLRWDMSWMIARDTLITQTMAFMKEVTGKKPETEARVEIVPIDSIQHVERPIQLEAPEPNRPASNALPDLREEIRSRIESFRAHQYRFHREREEYFNSVLAKVRASIGSEVPHD